jgi:hypothetical protein
MGPQDSPLPTGAFMPREGLLQLAPSSLAIPSSGS